MADDFRYKEVATGLPAETAMEVASAVASVVLPPWLSGPVANVLGGMGVGRKMERINEVLQGVTEELRGFKSEASETYVKTEEFEELLESTLLQSSRERSEEKRQVLRSYLVGAIRSASESYEDGKRFLQVFDQLQTTHISILRALALAPTEEDYGVVGSPIHTLQKRLPELPQGSIAEAIDQMNTLRITNLTSLNTMMTARGATDLRHAIKPLGQRLISFIKQ
jgi:hypothetical protein